MNVYIKRKELLVRKGKGNCSGVGRIVYISGKMNNEVDYVSNFRNAEEELYKKGFDVINPAKLKTVLPKMCNREDFLHIDLALLDLCDVIYMLEGWEESCGANREYGYALGKGLQVIYQKDKQE